VTVAEHRSATLASIPLGEGRMIKVGSHMVAVFHLRNGAVRATQARCPHRGGPLADGLLGDDHVVCPLHNRSYCLSSGEAGPGEQPIEVFPARVDGDGTIIVTLPVEPELERAA